MTNIYLAMEDYDKARENYEEALKWLETSLSRDHRRLARSIHNLGRVYERQMASTIIVFENMFSLK